MYLHRTPDASTAAFVKAISDFALITWSLKYGFRNLILNSTLLITCYDKKTCIRPVDRIWVHLLISQPFLMFASIIWSSKFGFSCEILNSVLLITSYNIKTCICSVGQMRVHFFISKQSLIFDLWFVLAYLIQNLGFKFRLATWPI